MQLDNPPQKKKKKIINFDQLFDPLKNFKLVLLFEENRTDYGYGYVYLLCKSYMKERQNRSFMSSLKVHLLLVTLNIHMH